MSYDVCTKEEVGSGITVVHTGIIVSRTRTSSFISRPPSSLSLNELVSLWIFAIIKVTDREKRNDLVGYHTVHTRYTLIFGLKRGRGVQPNFF